MGKIDLSGEVGLGQSYQVDDIDTPPGFPIACSGEAMCGDCGVCKNCRNNPNQFENLSDDEIEYVLDNASNPELMGAAIKKFFQKRKSRAKAFIAKKKATKKGRKIGKVGKIALGVLGGPFSLIAARRRLKKKGVTKKQILNKVRAKMKKMPKGLKVLLGFALAPLAPLLLATAPIAGVMTAKKIAERRKARKQLSAAVAKMPKETQEAAKVAIEPNLTELEEPQTAATKEIPVSNVGPGGVEVTEKKSGGIGALLPIAALAALPLIMGDM